MPVQGLNQLHFFGMPEFRKLRPCYGIVDKGSERLHKIAGEIVVIEHVIVEYSELGGVSVRNDLSYKSRKQNAVAVI